MGRIEERNLPALEGFAPRILKTLGSYPGMHRTGDRYARALFDCLLITYIDKFGLTAISQAIEKAFVWAYSLRLKMQVLQLASMDNYALNSNLFLLLKEATQPSDFLMIELPVVTQVNRDIKPIVSLFKEMRYCE